MDRRWLVAGTVAFAFAVVLGVGFVLWLAASDTPAAPRSAHKISARPRPKPAIANVRMSLPIPDDLLPPGPPKERPEPAEITGPDRGMMNVAVDQVLIGARDECIVPWMEREGDGQPLEIVFDAVLIDGRLADVGIRSMRLDLPADVVECVADQTWYGDWPEWDLPGEIRLQRAVLVKPPAPE